MYQSGKQTYTQLAEQFGCSIKTIQRRLDKHVIENPLPDANKVVVLMDTTYWGRGFGVMLFKDALTSRNLYKQYVKTESNLLYKQGIALLAERGFEVLAIVCDGRKGLLSSFAGILFRCVSSIRQRSSGGTLPKGPN